MTPTIVAALVSAAVALSICIFAHWLTRQRDSDNAIRALRTRFLVDTRLKLRSMVGEEKLDFDKLNEVFDQIHIFGDRELVAIAKKLYDTAMIEYGTARPRYVTLELDELVMAIRKQARTELRLPENDETFWIQNGRSDGQ
ncbi:MAG TPA: hypothetical protein VIT22_03285 [Pseudoxanthomonas sp.]